MCCRIEVYEKYIPGEDNAPDWESMGIYKPKVDNEFKYRRTFVLVEMIERPIEIPQNKKEFILRLMSGEDIICKGDYDTFCIEINDIEEKMRIEDELIFCEIEKIRNGLE